jgi:hypothetical protein
MDNNFTITITNLEKVIYMQTFETIDLYSLMALLNKPSKRTRSDKGQSRKRPPEGPQLLPELEK